MTQKEEKLREIIRQLSAEFFSRELVGRSLVTVTDVRIQSRGSRASILFTVMPEEDEKRVLEAAHRRLSDLREYLHEHSRIVRLPFLGVEIDRGEKNRRRIDEIEKNM